MAKYNEQKISVHKHGYQYPSGEDFERGYSSYEVKVTVPLTIQESMKIQGLVNQFSNELDKIIGFNQAPPKRIINAK